jgi:beta-1,4-mannosyl-glycoprotein beta-1,4-N-acetylglucosaminyltransferase
LHFTDTQAESGYFACSAKNIFAPVNIDPSQIALDDNSVESIILQDQYTTARAQQIITECHRVLKEQGILRIQIPNSHRSYIEGLFAKTGFEMRGMSWLNDKTTYEVAKVNSYKPKVFDCFSFFNELDILEIRLNELYDYVDYFVLAEMRVTHQGKTKPLYFAENKQRYAKFLDKIIHIVVDDIPQTDDPWVREHHQRNCIERGLANCNDQDIIIISDVDEIPRAESIGKFDRKHEWMYFEQTQYNYYLNYQSPQFVPGPGIFSRITTYEVMKRNGFNATDIRYRPITAAQKIIDGGWHFTWLGGAKKIVEKLESYAHREINIDEYKNLNEIQKMLMQI